MLTWIDKSKYISPATSFNIEFSKLGTMELLLVSNNTSSWAFIELLQRINIWYL